jgi:serine O-acetyltransferase
VSRGVRSRKDLRHYVRADAEASGATQWRFRYRVTRRVLYFQWLLRRTEYWENVHQDPLGRLVALVLRTRLHFLGERLGFTVPRNVFGPGLSIAHFGTVVIHRRSVVGENCRLHPDVTLGEQDGGFPWLGNDVWVGPGARIVGGIKIGDGAAVGANAVVLSDVPPRVTVAGVPARVVSERGSRGLLRRTVPGHPPTAGLPTTAAEARR